MTDCNVELLPCPLCGDKDEFNPSVATSYKYAHPGTESRDLVEAGHFIECDKCGCCGPIEPTEEEAIAKWNTRISPCTDEDVERVAGAIAASFERGSPDIAAGMRMDWQTWAPEARAAISAMNQIRSTDHE